MRGEKAKVLHKGSRLPLELRVLSQRAKDTLTALVDRGDKVTLIKRKSTPSHIRDAVSRLQSANHGLELATISALIHDFPLEGTDQDKGLVKRHINQGYFRVDGVNPQLEEVNRNLHNHPSQSEYTTYRLLADRTDKEKRALAITAVAFAAAVGLSAFFTAKGIQGMALFFAGQMDDMAGAAAVMIPEIAKGKTVGKALRDNWATAGGIAGAAFMDATFLPHMLETHDTTQLALASALYCFTAVAGSSVAFASSMLRNGAEMAKINSKQTPDYIPGYEEGSLSPLQVAKLTVKETFANPYMSWLTLGLGATLGASLFFGTHGMLEGHPLSSLVSSSIGPLETFTAIVGSKLIGEKLYQVRRKTKLRSQTV